MKTTKRYEDGVEIDLVDLDVIDLLQDDTGHTGVVGEEAVTEILQHLSELIAELRAARAVIEAVKRYEDPTDIKGPIEDALGAYDVAVSKAVGKDYDPEAAFKKRTAPRST